MSQVALWDKIILRGEIAMLDYRSMNTKENAVQYILYKINKSV